MGLVSRGLDFCKAIGLSPMPAQNAPANQTQNNSPRRGAGVGGKEAIRQLVLGGGARVLVGRL